MIICHQALRSGQTSARRTRSDASPFTRLKAPKRRILKQYLITVSWKIQMALTGATLLYLERLKSHWIQIPCPPPHQPLARQSTQFERTSRQSHPNPQYCPYSCHQLHYDPLPFVPLQKSTILHLHLQHYSCLLRSLESIAGQDGGRKGWRRRCWMRLRDNGRSLGVG